MDRSFTPGIAPPRQRGRREDPSLTPGNTAVDPPTLTNLTMADLAFLENLTFAMAPLIDLGENFTLECIGIRIELAQEVYRESDIRPSSNSNV